MSSTDHDAVRCGPNSTLASLTLRGPQALADGIGRARSALDAAVPPPSPEERGALDRLQHTPNQATVDDLSRASDVLYRRFVGTGPMNPDQPLQVNGRVPPATVNPRPTQMMTDADLLQMHSTLGLIPPLTRDNMGRAFGPLPDLDPNTSLGAGMTDAEVRQSLAQVPPDTRIQHQRDAAQSVWQQVADGRSAIVGVYNHNEQMDPFGAQNHFVSVGMRDGRPYLYDPGAPAGQNYLTDQAARTRLEQMMPLVQRSIELANPPGAHVQAVDFHALVIHQSPLPAPPAEAVQH